MTADQASTADAPSDRARAGRLRTYYVLLVAETVSLIGSLVSYLAVSIAVFRQTGHATPLALVEFFAAVPVIVTGGLAGALADRFDRRTMMLLANAGFVVCSGLLLLAFVSSAFQLWQLYALSFASAVFAALQRPAFQASVAMLAPEDRRDRANALGQMTGPVARMASPAVAGVIFSAVGVVGAIALDIATFLAAIVVLLVVRIPRPAETEEGRAFAGSVWRQAFDGFRYLAARPVLLALSGYNAVVTFLTFGALVLGTPYVLARTGSETTFGLVLSVLNVGAVAGAVVMSAWGGRWPRVRTVFLGFAAAGLFLIFAGVAQGAVALSAAFFGFAFLIPIVNAAMASIYQARVAPDLQGRVFAAIGQVGGVLTPAAFLVAGPLADRVFEPARGLPGWRVVAWAVGAGHGAGIGLLFVTGGALTTLLSLVVYAAPTIRRVETLARQD
jgi:DHA3 family macrolide efflux protein-like MFS transporter